MWFTAYQWPIVARLIVTALVGTAFGIVPLYLILFHHQVADLLIETQQEMRKVAWSTRGEVFASTAVVIVTVTLLALFIFGTDRVLLMLAQVFGIY
jgi:preprotein translocase SecE subunit